jgi:transcriptional regulator with XRE-family HTH domain
MPKRRPMDFLRRLGRRMRARRLHLGRARKFVAEAAEISVTQLSLYEAGQGHPPAATLHRIALTLGTTTSALLGETMAENAEQVDEMMQIYTHPVVGAVIRHLQDMAKDDQKTLQIIAAAFAHRANAAG